MNTVIEYMIEKTAEVMMWMGHYAEADILYILKRFLVLKGIKSLDEWEAFVNGEEDKAKSQIKSP